MPGRKLASGAGFALEIRPLQFNPLSLCGMPRLEHVADECRAHVVLLPDTRVRAQDNREYHTEKLGGGYWALHFGWKRGLCTNSSAGCSMIFPRRVKRHDLYRTVPAPPMIAGRGRMVRLRSGRFDWTVQVRYPPPLKESGERRLAQEKAIRLTLGFLQQKHRRSTPILGLDLNSGLGMKGSREQVEGPHVGESPRGEQKVAGYEMEKKNLLRKTDSTSIKTMFPDSGPTYFSPQGTSRTLDHWVGLVGIHHIVEECRVAKTTAHPRQTSTRPPAESVDFEILEALREDPTPDEHWALWVDCMRETAQTFPSLHRTSKRNDAQKRLSTLRCKLVSEQAIRREQMGMFWETYGHMGDYSEQHLHTRHRLTSLNWQLRRWDRQFAAARRASTER